MMIRILSKILFYDTNLTSRIIMTLHMIHLKFMVLFHNQAMMISNEILEGSRHQESFNYFYQRFQRIDFKYREIHQKDSW